MGRSRNLLTLPDGRRHWPSFPAGKWAHVAPVQQLQFIQKSRDTILVRIAAPRELTNAETAGLVKSLQDCLEYPFQINIERVPAIPRAANFKFEDFVSEVPD